MKRIIFLLAILSVNLVSAQMNTKQKGFTLDLGIGGTLHKIYNNVYTGNGANSFSNLVHLNLRYKDGILAYGLKFEHLDFVTQNDSSDVFKNAVANLLQYNTTFTLLEKKKLSFYLITGVGVGSLQYERLDTAGILGKIKMQGFSASATLGINYHFKGKFGIFAQAGYVYNVQHLTDFKVNGNFIEEFENRPIGEVVYNMRGIDFKTGIRFAF